MNPSSPDPASTLKELGERADCVLARRLPSAESPPQALHRAMRYGLLGGGKRLRPLLVYATGKTFGASLEALDTTACAVEMIHAYSLVHDDLPAMDDDALRRGRATCHVQFGEATAILAGDALQALAFAILAEPTSHCSPPVQLQMLRVLAAACGSAGMAGGQAMDLLAVGQTLGLEELERMHACKTGALIRASVRLGALAAGCEQAEVFEALDRYGHALGLAFQVRDDILDVEGDTDTLGKTAGKDAHHAKPTFPSTLGMAATRDYLREVTDDALRALESIDQPAALLQALARFAAARDY